MSTLARRDDEEVRRVVEHMAMTFATWGFPRMPARVLLTLMAADEDSLTAGELSERLGVSAAAISGAVRYLTHLGIIVREPVPGSRRDRYRLPDDVWYESSLTKTGLYKGFADLADDAVKALGGTDSPGGQRMGEMRDYFLFVNKEVVQLLDKWRATRARTGEAS
ncbi:GbsR/MarR family transcriptional regulator [Actinopolymorpha alba]|uniref:GbsR/MarR family transcriptional regulator n=1 Tax=Actinopolymorpha alba TaxID=533267 RepID=UPI000364D31A|nr:MarR family transcriptional regulator [Actinopolymorpha alba]